MRTFSDIILFPGIDEDDFTFRYVRQEEVMDGVQMSYRSSSHVLYPHQSSEDHHYTSNLTRSSFNNSEKYAYTRSIDYTVCSKEPSRYSQILCNLTASVTKYSELTVICLTAYSDIIVFNEDDYITINDNETHFNQAYSNFNRDMLTIKLNGHLNTAAKCFTYKTGLLTLTSFKEFILKDMSYNTKLITGFYISALPIESTFNEKFDAFVIKAESVAFMLSKPVLYLVSNVGMQSFRSENNDDLCGAKIVMKLNNSYCYQTI